MKKIKVGIVNYLNTAPLIYGLENSPVREDIELIPDYPSNLARDLMEGRIDLGLVPVAAIPELERWWLAGEYCIGSDGPVASVCIFSDVPLQQVEKIYLDNQSRTSVELAKLLLREHWRVSPELVAAEDGYIAQIGGPTAGLIIGDRALRQRSVSPYIYDLGEAWKEHTGLPFVFAAWISNRELPGGFIRSFNEANRFGLSRLQEVIALQPPTSFDLEVYYTRHISYSLDEAKRKGLERFLHTFANKFNRAVWLKH